MYLFQVSLVLFGLQGLGHFFRHRPCSPLAGGLCKFYDNAGGKQPIQRQLLLVQNKQQANPLLSMHNYTPLVISRNDKNKQLTSNVNSLEPREVHFLQYKIIGANKTFKKMAPSSIRPKTNHTCHQKPSTSHETAPLKGKDKKIIFSPELFSLLAGSSFVVWVALSYTQI
jgi:hypothetical protein